MSKTFPLAAFSVLIFCNGMSMAQSGAPKGWALQGSKPDAYAVQLDSIQKGPYGNSVLLYSKAESDGSATLMQAIKADDYRGKRVRFAGHIKGQGVKSWAGLWMRVNNNDNKVTAFDNMEKRAFRGDGDWKKFEVVLNIPGDSGTISFGALLSGTGRIWVSRLEFQVVDQAVPVTAESYAPELSRKPENLELN